MYHLISLQAAILTFREKGHVVVFLLYLQIDCALKRQCVSSLVRRRQPQKTGEWHDPIFRSVPK